MGTRTMEKGSVFYLLPPVLLNTQLTEMDIIVLHVPLVTKKTVKVHVFYLLTPVLKDTRMMVQDSVYTFSTFAQMAIKTLAMEYVPVRTILVQPTIKMTEMDIASLSTRKILLSITSQIHQEEKQSVTLYAPNVTSVDSVKLAKSAMNSIHPPNGVSFVMVVLLAHP
jgi:hypothetical protein